MGGETGGETGGEMGGVEKPKSDWLRESVRTRPVSSMAVRKMLKRGSEEIRSMAGLQPVGIMGATGGMSSRSIPMLCSSASPSAPSSLSSASAPSLPLSPSCPSCPSVSGPRSDGYWVSCSSAGQPASTNPSVTPPVTRSTATRSTAIRSGSVGSRAARVVVPLVATSKRGTTSACKYKLPMFAPFCVTPVLRI